jgi:hypothetical protein
LPKVWRKYKGRVPISFLPIGENDFGNLVCLNLDPNSPGVAYWDHEKEDLAYDIIAEIPPLGTESLMKIAGTFADLVEMLGEIPPES